jgi:uncharacterized protein HemX
MEGASEAVTTLSGTAFGAIIVMMAVGFSAAFVMMAKYIRQMHKEMMDLAESRVKETEKWSEKSQELLRESMNMIHQATEALEDHREKICEMDRNCTERIREVENDLQRLKKDVNCRECPARAKAFGG